MRRAAFPSAFATRAGRRPSNQDAVLVRELPGGRRLLALADGMGGHNAGEEASRRALEVLERALSSGLTLAAAVTEANAAVHAAAAENPEWHGMGTTLVALLQIGRSYRVANVGDSRAYRVDASGIRLLTEDHTVLAEARREGGEAAREVEGSRWRHALTRALGTGPTVQPDLYGPFPTTEPHAVLLTSDGLHGSLSQERIARSLGYAPDPQSAAEHLADQAYEAGSTDNISVVVAWFDERSGPHGVGFGGG